MAHPPPRMHAVHVDRVQRFSLDIDRATARTFVGIPVDNGMVEYTEWYAVDPLTFVRYLADPSLALEFVERCRARELDHLLLLPPGDRRGWA